MHTLAQSHGLSWWIGLVAGGLLSGALFGLIPLLLGYCLRQAKLGWLGLAASIVSGLIGGLPTAGVSVGISAAAIYSAWRRSRAERGSPPGPTRDP